MHITVELFPARQERVVELRGKPTGLELVSALGLAPDAHLLVRGDLPIPVDAPLVDGERLRIISVVSGGRE